MGLNINQAMMEALEKSIRKANEGDRKDMATAEAEVKKSDGAFDKVDLEILKHGKKIILPDDPREMTTTEAIKQLQRLAEQEQLEVSIHEEVNAFPLEGAWALMQVLRARYGWANAQPTPGFFGPRPPVMVTLETGPGKSSQVIWGDFNIPGVEGKITTSGMRNRDGRPIFVISGVVKKKYQDEIKQISDEVRRYVRENSLYRGKAIKLITKKNNDGEFQVSVDQPPRFMDLSKINENELIFSEDVLAQIETNLFAPIERTAERREYKVPLKRTLLFEGPYGTGKTLTASVSGVKCVRNGWTYIYVDRAEGLKEAMIFARDYQPAMIFVEDIEQITTGGRTTAVNDILNNIDGVDSKGQEIICVFTTNHIEKIEKAMLRPGRIDAIITVNPPDAKAAEKLIRLYASGLIDAKEDLSAAGTELDGQIPAVIREVVERAKLYAIGRLGPGEKLKLTGVDIKLSAVGMKKHLEFMNPKSKENVKTNAEQLGDAFTKIVVETIEKNTMLGSTQQTVKEIKEH